MARVNNSLSNLGNPTSDINYGAWGTYMAVTPLFGFKTSMYEGGIKPLLVTKRQIDFINVVTIHVPTLSITLSM